MGLRPNWRSEERQRRQLRKSPLRSFFACPPSLSPSLFLTLSLLRISVALRIIVISWFDSVVIVRGALIIFMHFDSLAFWLFVLHANSFASHCLQRKHIGDIDIVAAVAKISPAELWTLTLTVTVATLSNCVPCRQICQNGLSPIFTQAGPCVVFRRTH